MESSSFESQIENSIYQSNPEKTFVGKTLAENQVKEIEEIMQKEVLTRSDLLRLLYLMSSNETKLVNFDEWDRYIVGKFLTWIRDFTKVCEKFFDYEEHLIKNKDFLGETALNSFLKSKNTMHHNLKFLADMYFYITRSTLSLEAMAFEGILKNRYEYDYRGMPAPSGVPHQEKGFWSKFKR